MEPIHYLDLLLEVEALHVNLGHDQYASDESRKEEVSLNSITFLPHDFPS